MSLTRLKPFRVVAWDFDGVLFNHANSVLFHRFIRRNPYRQVHHIVTHRSHGGQFQIWRLLEAYGEGLGPTDFAELFNVPDEYWEDWTRCRAYRAKTRTKEPLPEEMPYLTWKGEICKQIRADVLIDDDREVNFRGCDAHGIKLIHPDELG